MQKNSFNSEVEPYQTGRTGRNLAQRCDCDPNPRDPAVVHAPRCYMLGAACSRWPVATAVCACGSRSPLPPAGSCSPLAPLRPAGAARAARTATARRCYPRVLLQLVAAVPAHYCSVVARAAGARESGCLPHLASDCHAWSLENGLQTVRAQA